MVSHRHTYGNGIYLPVASTSAMLLTAILEVEVPESQKQSVSDAFHNVVLPPSLFTAHFSHKINGNGVGRMQVQRYEVFSR